MPYVTWSVQVNQSILVEYQAKAKRSYPERESEGSGAKQVVVNSYGGLSSARYIYDATGDVAELVESYLEWADRPVYIVSENLKNPGSYKSFRGAKRGDSFYCYKTLNRWDILIDTIQDDDYHVGRTMTGAVWVTLTYANQCEENWETIGRDFNRFISGLRKRYGEIDVVRTWESHESGYPHSHAILLFRNKRFKTFRYNEVWRLEAKDELAECWKYGNSDWQGVYDLWGMLGYLKKYMRKFLSHDVKHATRNLAKLWVHRKRTFSVSRRLDRAMSYSNRNLFRKKGQMTLEGELIEEENWQVRCVVSSMVDLTKVRIVDVNELAKSGWISRYAITFEDVRS